MPVARLNSGRVCGGRVTTRRTETPPVVDAGGGLISDPRCRRGAPATMRTGVNALGGTWFLKLLTIEHQCILPIEQRQPMHPRIVMSTRRRFTDDQVRDIRQSPLSARELAKQYRVSHQTILNIRDSRTYKDVSDHLGPGLKSQYVFQNVVDFLAGLPDGYCGTAVTSPPTREVPSILGRSSGWTMKNEWTAEQEYVDLQRRVITECLRVVGPTGVLFYHQMYTASSRRRINLRHEIIRDFPLRQAIIWNHQMRRFIPGGRHFNRLPNNYGMIFIFSGPRWSIPKESRAAAMRWGDLWNIKPDSMDELWDNKSGRLTRLHPPALPVELADRCIALGSGMVLNPFAGTGSVPLAAIRAGRDWLACDSDPAYLDAFQMRRSMMDYQ